jgi:hypothetical protein
LRALSASMSCRASSAACWQRCATPSGLDREPDMGTLEELAEGWRPYRMWVCDVPAARGRRGAAMMHSRATGEIRVLTGWVAPDFSAASLGSGSGRRGGTAGEWEGQAGAFSRISQRGSCLTTSMAPDHNRTPAPSSTHRRRDLGELDQGAQDAHRRRAHQHKGTRKQDPRRVPRRLHTVAPVHQTPARGQQQAAPTAGTVSAIAHPSPRRHALRPARLQPGEQQGTGPRTRPGAAVC